MESQTGDQTAIEKATGTTAVVVGDDNGGEDQQQEVGDVEKDRAREGNPRAMVLNGAVGSSVESVGPGAVAKDTPMVGGSSGGGDGSGAVGNDPRPKVSPPRDSARGKGAVIAEK
ncbi:hypothetical protein RHMOL_Rhmol11G0010800 [Rhododendron molle]|uniref:Uncharacterized protein n=1 Tax=Rhododendron molle TaxID=49168 RepID=A0ACC0LMH6_RHOML|nr:hypothetical protein RHMOL_Rhmol11G0010800 [Rhododendron molle]